MPFLPDTAVIEFEDGEAVMRLVGLPLRRFIEIEDLAYQHGGPYSNEDLARLAAVIDEHRVSWTWAAEDAMGLPWQYIVAVARAWLGVIGRAPLPLPLRRSQPDGSDAPTSSPEP